MIKSIRICRFCSLSPLQSLQNQIKSHHFQELFKYLDNQASNKGVKQYCKSIFSLEQAIQAEQKYSLQNSIIEKEIEQFLLNNSYNLRYNPSIKAIELSKWIKNEGEFVITLYSKEKELSNIYNRESLALHELKDFDKYFDYKKITTPELKQDEELRQEGLRDMRLDIENPLGLDLNEMKEIEFFISIIRKNSVFMLMAQTAQGKMNLNNIVMLDDFNTNVNWEERLLSQLKRIQDDYVMEILNFSDPFQKKIIDYISSFGFKASDLYYLELLSLYHTQTQYLNWLKRIQNMILDNQIHT